MKNLTSSFFVRHTNVRFYILKCTRTRINKVQHSAYYHKIVSIIKLVILFYVMCMTYEVLPFLRVYFVSVYLFLFFLRWRSLGVSLCLGLSGQEDSLLFSSMAFTIMRTINVRRINNNSREKDIKNPLPSCYRLIEKFRNYNGNGVRHSSLISLYNKLSLYYFCFFNFTLRRNIALIKQSDLMLLNRMLNEKK